MALSERRKAYQRQYRLSNLDKARQQGCESYQRTKEETTARLRGDYSPDKRIVKRKCQKHGLTDYMRSPGTIYKCVKCLRDSRYKRRRNCKTQIVAAHGGKCVVCGYSKNINRSLHFHHLNKSTKSFNIVLHGSNGGSNIEELILESQKCLLVCANCHGEIEDGLLDVSSYKSSYIAPC